MAYYAPECYKNLGHPKTSRVSVKFLLTLENSFNVKNCHTIQCAFAIQHEVDYNSESFINLFTCAFKNEVYKN